MYSSFTPHFFSIYVFVFAFFFTDIKIDMRKKNYLRKKQTFICLFDNQNKILNKDK